MSCVPGFPHSQSPLSLWGLSGCPQLSQLTVTETVSVRGEKWTGQRGCTSAGAALKILFIFILWPFYLFIFLTCCSDKTLWQLGLLEPMKYILTYCSTSQWVKSNRWSHDNNIPFWVKSPNSLHSFKNHSRFGFNLFLYINQSIEKRNVWIGLCKDYANKELSVLIRGEEKEGCRQQRNDLLTFKWRVLSRAVFEKRWETRH